MRNIKFKQVGMRNFCNYIEPMELVFENGKLVIITGPNGVGKSNIFQAIPFTLYGITTDGKRGDDVVNNIIGKNCHTWLEFQIDDINYRMDRYHQFTRKGNTVELSKDGEKPYKVGQKEILPEIEKLIMPRKLFINTILFSQDIKDFFTALTDTQQKEIFRKVLQLDNYVLYHKEATDRIKTIANMVVKLNQEIELRSKLLEDSNKQIVILEQAEKKFKESHNLTIKNFEIELNNSIKSKDKLLSELGKLNIYLPKIESITTKINMAEQKISELNLIIENKKHDINNKALIKETEINKSIMQKKTQVETLFNNQKTSIIKNNNNEIQKATKESNSNISDLNIKIAILSNEIKLIEEQVIDIKVNVIDKDISTCPTCYQKIGPEEKKLLQNKVVFEYNVLIKNQKLKQEKHQGDLKILKDQIQQTLQSLKDNHQQQINNIEKKKEIDLLNIDNQSEKILLELKNRIAIAINENTKEGINKKDKLKLDLGNLNIENEELQIIKTKIDNLKIQIPTIILEINNIEKNIRLKKEEEYDDKQLIIYINKSKVFKHEIGELTSKRLKSIKYSTILEFWKIGYSSSGIPSMLIDEAIPFLNRRVSYYLDKISMGRYTVSFDTISTTKSGETRDKISVNVLDNKTKANSRVQLSGGQTRLVDIATILTFNDLQSYVQDVSINLLLFDEIFDSLDDTNIAQVSSVIRNLTTDRFVSIISHRYIDQIEADSYLNLH